MRINSYPDRIVLVFGVGIVGFLILLSFLVTLTLKFIAFAAIPWSFLVIYLFRKYDIIYILTEDKFVIKFMGKTIVLPFDDITCIEEISNYNNPKLEKKYRIITEEQIREYVLIIQNKRFSEWLKSHSDSFKIVKRSVID